MDIKTADLHIHSDYSDAKCKLEDILDYVENKTDLDIIAITDHNTIKGALKAKKLNQSKQMRVKIIIGEEISCQEGHLVGLFLKKEIPSGLPVFQVLKLIKKQKGISIASHPFVSTPLRDYNGNKTGGLGLDTILIEKNNIDALETVNGNLIMKFKENPKAKYINNSFLFKTAVGGSDAHILSAIGKGYTIFIGDDAKDLKQAILRGNTFAVEKKWGFTSALKYILFIAPEIIGVTKVIIKIKSNEFIKKMAKIYHYHFNSSNTNRAFSFIFISNSHKNKTNNCQ